MKQGKYYVESGRVSGKGAAISFAVAAAAGAVVGFVYGVVDMINPMIFLNVLGVILLAGAVGAGAHFGRRIGHVRKDHVADGAALFGGLVGLYFAWGGWFFALTSWSSTFLTNPNGLWLMIKLVNMKGAWSLKGSTPTGGILWVIWACEALIVIGGAWLVVRSMGEGEAYCEGLDCWADEETVGTYEVPGDLAAVQRAFEDGDYSAIGGWTRRAASDAEVLKATVKYCESPQTPYFLTLDVVTRSTNAKGEEEEDTSNFFRLMNVTKEVRELVAGGGGAAGGAGGAEAAADGAKKDGADAGGSESPA